MTRHPSFFPRGRTRHARRATLLGIALGTATLLGCSERPTAPPATRLSPPNASGELVTADVSSASVRSGALHMTKECSSYTGLAGSYCTIASSNVKEIPVGSRVIYASALTGGTLDTDIMLDPPGPGNNRAFGHVVLDLAKASGTVTFDGGTGQFSHFHAQAAITLVSKPTWAWTGTYSFGDSHDDAMVSTAQALAPNFNLEIILRPADGGNGFGHVTFRQANDDATRIDLGVWVRDLAPNTHYQLQRAVDTAIDDNCTSNSWLTLGEGLVAQDIVTDDRGTAKQDLFRVLTTPVGTPFDIHFRIVTAGGAPVLTSDCYQYYVR